MKQVASVVLLAVILFVGFWVGRVTAPEPVVQADAEESPAPTPEAVPLEALPADVVALLKTRAETKTKLAGDAPLELPTPDQDGDRLADDDELENYGTDPTDPDTDGDRVPDGTEVTAGSDPLVASFDVASSPDLELCLGVGTSAAHWALGAACRIVTVNLAACTGTCAGTCLGGLFTCGWGWNGFQYAYDIATAAPCPGWTCLCP